jgi:hypothetical protein
VIVQSFLLSCVIVRILQVENSEADIGSSFSGVASSAALLLPRHSGARSLQGVGRYSALDLLDLSSYRGLISIVRALLTTQMVF